MSPAITSGLVLTVLFTVFILFSKTTIENSVEISQDVNNAAVIANEKLSTNLVMTNVRILDGCNFEATVKNQGTTDIQNFKDMNVLIDFPEEPGINNENIVLNYTSIHSLNPGEWTHTINPNLNLNPNSNDVHPSCCGKDDEDEKQIIVFASNRDTNDSNYEIYSINVHGGNETRLTNNLTNDQFPSWSPDGTKIVFASNRDGNYEIYTMNADGTNQTRLTNHINTDYYPTWSHDGAKIAFTSWRDGNGEIYTMDADGTNLTNVTNNIKEDSSPSWSLDGTKIVFHTDRDGNSELYTMNTDGTNQVRITETTWADEMYPVWSPDGTKIVFQSNIMIVQQELFYMDSDGTNITRITNNSTEDKNATWAPDETSIAFQTDRDGNTEIYLSELPDTSHITQITNTKNNLVPSWSPDGTKIVFQSTRDGNTEIYTMDTDGTNLTNVTNNASEDQYASWSADGTKIVFHTDRDGNWEIYTMNSDGTNLNRITNNLSIDIYPHWSPIGNKITFSTLRDGNWEIYSMNPDGTNQTNITNNLSNDLLSTTSSDGNKIAFRSNRDGNDEIYIMNTDGTNQTRLTNHPNSDSNPSWSPDGSKLVFERYEYFNRNLYSINSDGTNLTNISNNRYLWDAYPSWSPDGNNLAFRSGNAIDGDIYVMDISKTLKQRQLHNLTNDDYDDLSEKFSIKEPDVLNPGETMNIKGRATLSTGTSTDPRWIINLISDTGVKASKTGSQITYLNGIFRTPDNRSLFGTADTVLYNKDGWIPVQSLDGEWRTASGAAEIVLDQEGNAHGIIGESYLDLELPYDGTYLIEIGSNGTIRPGNNTSVGNYNIILNNQWIHDETPNIGDSTNEGFPIPQGAQEINPGEWKFGEINTEDDVDWWEFDGVKGEQITIKISYTNDQSIGDWVSGLEGFTFKLYNYKTAGSINC